VLAACKPVKAFASQQGYRKNTIQKLLAQLIKRIIFETESTLF